MPSPEASKYCFSARKRQLDLAVAMGLRVASSCVTLGMRSRGHEPGFITVDRIGQHGIPFDLHKLVLPPAYLGLGIDEIAQWTNIMRGEMSAVGHRPLEPEGLEAFYDALTGAEVDSYRRVVMVTKPGIFSTYTNSIHLGTSTTNGAQCRYERDMKDAIDASLARDVKIIGSFFTTALRGLH